MNEVVMDFPLNKGEKQRKLKLDKGLRDAIRDMLRERWPQGTAKYTAREFRMSLDQARHAVRGDASISAIEAIIKRGGLPVALALVEQVTGQSIARYFIEMRQANEDHGRRIAALVWNPWTGRGPGAPGDAGGDWLASDVGVSSRRRVGQG